VGTGGRGPPWRWRLRGEGRRIRVSLVGDATERLNEQRFSFSSRYGKLGKKSNRFFKKKIVCDWSSCF
jgi:hypothetical protein